jgi:hypothetical protein
MWRTASTRAIASGAKMNRLKKVSAVCGMTSSVGGCGIAPRIVVTI